jgi:hypothetical protein
MEPTKRIYTVEKDPYFDTQYPFQNAEEKALADRYLRWKRNKYIAYAAINANHEAFTPDGKSLLFSTQSLKHRFDELLPWHFMIVDKEFIDNNPLPREYWNGKRYIYMVDQPFYDSKVTQSHKPRSIAAKEYPGIRICRTYEAVIEKLEEGMQGLPIIVLGRQSWAALRYFIDQLQLTYSDELPLNETDIETTKFPLQKFEQFLGFNAMSEVKHNVKTLISDSFIDAPDELPEQLSDYIKFSYPAKLRKLVEQKQAGQHLQEENYKYITVVKRNR